MYVSRKVVTEGAIVIFLSFSTFVANLVALKSPPVVLLSVIVAKLANTCVYA